MEFVCGGTLPYKWERIKPKRKQIWRKCFKGLLETKKSEVWCGALT
jgi:hypothetical protein